MDESERIQRRRDNCHLEISEIDEIDRMFADRIAALLNHPQIDEFCMVDAYYYDFSVIPRGVQGKLNLWNDCYLLFGITTEGDLVHKWVNRWDLDSKERIVNGEVIHSEKKCDGIVIPEIRQKFNPDLLSTPCEYIFKLFK